MLSIQVLMCALILFFGVKVIKSVWPSKWSRRNLDDWEDAIFLTLLIVTMLYVWVPLQW